MLVDGAGGGEVHPGGDHDGDVYHAVGGRSLRAEIAIVDVHGDLGAGIRAQGGRGRGAQADGAPNREAGQRSVANSATRMAGWGKRPEGRM